MGEKQFQKKLKRKELWDAMMGNEQERVIIEKALQSGNMTTAVTLQGQIYVLINYNYLVGPFVEMEDGYYCDEGDEKHSIKREDYEPYKWVYGCDNGSLWEHYMDGTVLGENEKE